MLETIFLYLILHDDNSEGERFRTPMPDMPTCMKVIEGSKMTHPSTVGGDYEVMSVMFCGYETMYRNYNGYWHNEPIRDEQK